jgi:hypothetical protein
MENLIEPNIHPVLVHFAFALTVTAAVSYALTAPPAMPVGVTRCARRPTGCLALRLWRSSRPSLQATRLAIPGPVPRSVRSRY